MVKEYESDEPILCKNKMCINRVIEWPNEGQEYHFRHNIICAHCGKIALGVFSVQKYCDVMCQQMEINKRRKEKREKQKTTREQKFENRTTGKS